MPNGRGLPASGHPPAFRPRARPRPPRRRARWRATGTVAPRKTVSITRKSEKLTPNRCRWAG